MAVESPPAESFQAGLATLIVAAGVAGKVLWEMFKPSEKKEPSQHIVLEAAQLADMNPIRDLAGELRRTFDVQTSINKNLERVVELMEKREAEEALQKAVDARLEARLSREREG